MHYGSACSIKVYCKKEPCVPNFISEDQIEKATMKLLKEKLGYELLNAYTPDPDEYDD